MIPPRPTFCASCSAPLGEADRVCPQCGGAVPGLSATELFAPSSSPAPSMDSTTPAPSDAVPSPWETVLERLREATQGEFEIGRELGRGGMAAVFLGRDLALNRRVAIKVMAPGIMMGEGMVERFRQEAITIANLQHAHIVSIYAVRQYDDLHYFVMQFVAGQALDAVLRSHGRLAIPAVRAILFQVGSALAYAHRRGVVHRDIKPGNILMSGDGDALVTDFGIAKVAEGPTQTQTGMVVGTPTYMSPEQCYAQPLDGRSDQYSLGVVAYELLAGVPPFTGSAFEIMRGHTTEPAPPLGVYRPDLPPEMEAAIMRMLSKEPGDRFPGFAEALAAMGATAVGEGDPLRGELVRLAAVEERRTMLGELLHTPNPSATPGGGTSRRSGVSSGARSSHAPGREVPPTAAAQAPRPDGGVATEPTRGRLALWYGVAALVVVVAAGGAGAVAWFGGGEGANAGPADAEIRPGAALAADSTAVPDVIPPAVTEAPDATAAEPPSEASDQVSDPAPDQAPARAPVQRPAASPTPTRAAPAAVPSASAEALAAQREEQSRLAREARTVIESFASAVETRQLARVRAVYAGLSAGNVETFDNMFRSTTAVRMRIGEIRVVNGAAYDAAVGSRTYLTADVTFELIPVGGGTIPPADDVLPVTLQRTASGWRLEQIGVP